MSTKTTGICVLYWALFLSQVRGETAFSHNAASILKPLRQLQIILRPLTCTRDVAEWIPNQNSLQYSAQAWIPLQIFCGPVLEKPFPHYQATRYVEHQVVWFTFVKITSDTSTVPLGRVLYYCCINWGGFEQSEPINKHRIYLIVDKTDAPR